MKTIKVYLQNEDGTHIEFKELDDFPFTIGRDPKSNICIRDPNSSRNHATIEKRKGNFLLIDQKSRNGTFNEDGEKITEINLEGVMRFRIGVTWIEIHVDNVKMNQALPKYSISLSSESEINENPNEQKGKPSGNTSLIKKDSYTGFINKKVAPIASAQSNTNNTPQTHGLTPLPTQESNTHPNTQQLNTNSGTFTGASALTASSLSTRILISDPEPGSLSHLERLEQNVFNRISRWVSHPIAVVCACLIHILSLIGFSLEGSTSAFILNETLFVACALSSAAILSGITFSLCKLTKRDFSYFTLIKAYLFLCLLAFSFRMMDSHRLLLWPEGNFLVFIAGIAELLIYTLLICLNFHWILNIGCKTTHSWSLKLFHAVKGIAFLSLIVFISLHSRSKITPRWKIALAHPQLSLAPRAVPQNYYVSTSQFLSELEQSATQLKTSK